MKRFVVCVAVLAFLLAGVVSAEEKKAPPKGAQAKAEVKKTEYPKAAAAKKAERPKAAEAKKKAENAKKKAAAKAAHAKKADAKKPAPRKSEADKKKPEAARKKAEAIKAAHPRHGKPAGHPAGAKRPAAPRPPQHRQVDTRTGPAMNAMQQRVEMEKHQLARLTQLLKRIQNVARQEKAENTVKAIENAIALETEGLRKRVVARTEAIKKTPQKHPEAAKKAEPRRRPEPAKKAPPRKAPPKKHAEKK